MNFKKNQELEITITSITHDGLGVGKIDGFAFFVPFTAIGDVLIGQIVKLQKSFGYMKVVSFKEKSKDRVDVDCNVFTQ